MNYKLDITPTANDDDSADELSEVEESENDIYFYSSVTKKAIFELNKKLASTSKSLVITGINLDIDTPEIRLHINSGGGSLIDSFSAIDYIRNCKAPVHSIIEGHAASAATLMSVVAKKRSITKHSVMLIHQLSAGMWGKFESMKDEIENATLFMNTINEIYTKHTKIPKSVLKEILKRDIYMDAKTCLKYGLVDKIMD
jgi:ATP-dependent Clp protease protease subunit